MIRAGFNTQAAMQFPDPVQPAPSFMQHAFVGDGEDFRKRFGIDRIRRAISASRQGMDKFLRVRQEVIRQIAGSLADAQQTSPMPMNKMAFMFITLHRFLVPGNMKCLVTAKAPQIEPAAKALQQVLNKVMARSDMRDVVRRIVAQALVGTGFSKVGWGDDGLPQLMCITMDDIFCDIAAESWNDITFIGHKYLANIDRLKEFSQNNPQFNQAAIDSLLKDADGDNLGEVQINSQMSQDWQKSAQDVFYSSMDDMRRQRMERLVRLYDVYIPQHRVTLTLSDVNDDVVRVMPNPSGQNPYDAWVLEELPGTILSGGPCERLKAINLHIQNVYMQNAESAAAAKTFLGYPKGRQDEAGAIAKAIPGTAVPMSSAADVKVFTIPGVDGMQQAYAMQLVEAANSLGGNYETLAGVGQQAPTLGQDELIAASSSRTVDFMQKAIYETVQKVIKKAAWMIWHESEQTYNYTQKIKIMGKDEDIAMVFRPGDRDFDFETLDVEIAPYAEVVRTPSERLRDLTNIFTTFVIPLQQQLMQQGMMVDVKSFMARVAEYSDLPELASIVVPIPPEILMQMQAMQEQGGQQAPSGKPAETTRNYVRRSEAKSDSATQREKLMQSKGTPNTAGMEKP